MNKYNLNELSQKDIKNCSHFAAGLIKLQRQIGKGIIQYDFIDELIAENEARGNVKILAHLTNV